MKTTSVRVNGNFLPDISSNSLNATRGDSFKILSPCVHKILFSPVIATISAPILIAKRSKNG
jgi:hypothetical protein